jgi:hypothetical protein
MKQLDPTPHFDERAVLAISSGSRNLLQLRVQ